MSVQDAPEARGASTIVWTGERMIVWGGHNTPSSPLKSGGIYDPKTDTWESMANHKKLEPRSNHTAVWTGERMIVWGGHNLTSTALSSGGIYIYND